MTTRLPAHIEPPDAAVLLRDWGFLAHADLPDGDGPSYLLVAIRPRPTEAHFDPEAVEYWVTDAGRGAQATLDRLTHLPIDTATTWGLVSIRDRLRETNAWLSFGGRLRAEVIDGAIIAVFTSPAPLLRRGGHSQGWDDGAPSVGAFFAKVRALAGDDHRFEAAEAAADPMARYSCFLAEQERRYRRSEVMRALDPGLWRLIQHEAHRLKESEPAGWEAGSRLLDALDTASTRQLQGDFASI